MKRTDKNGKSPITMVIAANGERAEFQTGRKIEPENWDNGKQQAKGKTSDAKLLIIRYGTEESSEDIVLK